MSGVYKGLRRKHSTGRPPPGYSFDKNGTIVTDTEITNILKDYRLKPEFQNAGGCKILPHYIRRDHGIVINHKKVYRICNSENLLLPRHIKKIKFYKKISKNRKINRPNQLWQFDIKTGYIHGENKHFYFLAIIDVFTREIINYHLGYNCKAKDLLATVEEAIKNHCPVLSELVIRSDNGPQMTSNIFFQYIREIGLEHEFIPTRTPNKNAYIEAMFSIFETQFLQVWYFKNMYEVFEKVIAYVEFYNTKRLHGAIKRTTPLEFKKLFYEGRYENYQVSA